MLEFKMGAYLLQGFNIGLTLAVLVGPIVVLLIQLSLEEGTLSSLCAAVGIWCSDILYILGSHFSMGKLSSIAKNPNFEAYIGSIGGLILLIVGLVMWRRRPIHFREVRADRRPRYGMAFLKGFAINTFNPFPIVFWSSVSVGIVYEDQLNSNETLALYGAIVATVIVTDTLKVFAARYLRKWLTPSYARVVQRIGAGALMIFGLILWVRVWM